MRDGRAKMIASSLLGPPTSATHTEQKLPDDPRFPRGMRMARELRLFDEDGLDAYDEMLKAEGGA